jgi:hypothetical protein
MAALGPAMTGPGAAFSLEFQLQLSQEYPETNRIAASSRETAFSYSRISQGLVQVHTAC